MVAPQKGNSFYFELMASQVLSNALLVPAVGKMPRASESLEAQG